MVVSEKLTLDIVRIAAGGEGVAHDEAGRVVFVAGAIPGDTVVAQVNKSKKRFAKAQVVEVLEPGRGRREAPCPHVAQRCGGCDWQHIEPATQSTLRVQIVLDSLERIGRLDPAHLKRVVHSARTLNPTGYRTSIRAIVSGGRAGFRMAASHRGVPVSQCLISHPLVEELLVDGDFGQATEVSIRVGANTGERLVVASPNAQGVRVPDDVVLVGSDELAAGRQAYYHEQIGDTTFRISAQSFFQCRPDGAELLTELARAAVGSTEGPLLDAYCGVGLFGAIAGVGRQITGVEENHFACADARQNLGPDANVFTSAIASWDAGSFGAVIADPARVGLGAIDAAVLVATGAKVIVLVSCDPGALGRDAGLLCGHGYELDRVDVVDLFGQTSHIECVSRFVRS